MTLHRLAFSVLAVMSVALALAALHVRAQWIKRKVASAVIRSAPTPASRFRCGEGRQDIVIIGDSRIARWPMHLFEKLPVVNKGIGGETALQLASRFEREVLTCHARSVLIAAGINDLVAASLAPGDKAREIVNHLPDRLISLAEGAARAGAKVSIATVVPPSRPDLLRRLVWSETVRAYVLTVNARLRAHAWTGEVTLVDFATALDPQGTGILPDRFRIGTLHINATAYELLTPLVRFVPPVASDTAL